MSGTQVNWERKNGGESMCFLPLVDWGLGRPDRSAEIWDCHIAEETLRRTLTAYGRGRRERMKGKKGESLKRKVPDTKSDCGNDFKIPPSQAPGDPCRGA